MAVFPSFKLTKKGEELLNRSIGEGKKLTFTKFEIGDGNPPSDFREQTSLVNKFYQFPVLSTDIQKNQVLRIKGYFDNKSFLGDKQLKEIGVYITIENDPTEYLYSYTNAGDTGDVIPAASRGFYSRTLDVANYIGYATNITFKIEQLRDRYAFNTEAEMKAATYLKNGDKIELWGNLVLGDKPIDEYIIQDSGEVLLENKLYAKKLSKKYVAGTISELQKLNLKENDVVEVLGYYTAGDGAGHERIIKNEDDGSGVQLDNGKWANIIKTKNLTVDCFGADPTGKIDSSDAIIKYYKWNDRKVYFNKGEYKVSKSLPAEWYCSYISIYDANCTIGVTKIVMDENLEFLFTTEGTNVNLAYNMIFKNIIFYGHKNDTSNKTKVLFKSEIEVTSIRFENCSVNNFKYGFSIFPKKYNTPDSNLVSYLAYAIVHNCNISNVDTFINLIVDPELHSGKHTWANHNLFVSNTFKCNCILEVTGGGFGSLQNLKFDNCSMENFYSLENGTAPSIIRGKMIPESLLFENCYIEGFNTAKKYENSLTETIKREGKLYKKIYDYTDNRKERNIYTYKNKYYCIETLEVIDLENTSSIIDVNAILNCCFKSTLIASYECILKTNISWEYASNLKFDSCTLVNNGMFTSRCLPNFIENTYTVNLTFTNTNLKLEKPLSNKGVIPNFDNKVLDISTGSDLYKEVYDRTVKFYTTNSNITNGLGTNINTPLLVPNDAIIPLINDQESVIISSEVVIDKLYHINNANITGKNSTFLFKKQSYGYPYLMLKSTTISNVDLKIDSNGNNNNLDFNYIITLKSLSTELCLKECSVSYTKETNPIYLIALPSNLSYRNVYTNIDVMLLKGNAPVGSKYIKAPPASSKIFVNLLSSNVENMDKENILTADDLLSKINGGV